MTLAQLPPRPEMLQAIQERDSRFDGVFLFGVRTTGVFCRPSCGARPPRPENVRFFASAREAMADGFRACKRCRPLQPRDETPQPIRELIDLIEANPSLRLRDQDLRDRGLEPAAVRRWFKKHHGMTFHGYQRGRRLSRAIGELADGRSVTRAAYGNGYESMSGFQDALRQITGRSPAASRDAAVVHLDRVTSPLGTLLVGAAEEGICLVEFTDRRMLETQLRRVSDRLGCAFLPGPTPLTEQMAGQLAEYFAGERSEFDVPLSTVGTPFQQRVWDALRTIPFGETRSYAQQAEIIGQPSAVRAVARANGDNRIAIVIPCHRVIGANGRLTGYGGGLWRKKWLLAHEGVEIAETVPQLELGTG